MSIAQDHPEDDEPGLGETPAAPVAEVAEDTPAPAPKEVKKNFTASIAYTVELAKGAKIEERVALPSASPTALAEAAGHLYEQDVGEGNADQAWRSVLMAGSTNVPYGQGLEATAEREDAEWVQVIEHGASRLQGVTPPVRAKAGVKPVGDVASFYLRSALGQGTAFRAPLWHSGFWLTVRSPGDAALLELHRRMNAEKISLGRQTYGYLYTNNTSYISQFLVDFVLDHVYEASVAYQSREELLSLIRLPDLQALLWAMVCARYPNGFQYERACAADTHKCHHIVEERLSVQRLLWVDKPQLTEFQKSHMTKRQRNAVTKEDLARYVADFVRGQPKSVTLIEKTEDNDGVSIELAVPSIADHLNAGYAWVNGIEETYGRLLQEDAPNRDKYLLDQGRATTMRQYSHYVKKICTQTQNDETLEFDEQSIIDKMLDDMSSNDELRMKFMSATRDYLDESVVAMVAVPTYTCPKCGGHNTGERMRGFEQLIALDVQSTFFQLLVQIVQKIASR